MLKAPCCFTTNIVIAQEEICTAHYDRTSRVVMVIIGTRSPFLRVRVCYVQQCVQAHIFSSWSYNSTTFIVYGVINHPPRI